jgi:glycerate 2-kinase
MNGPIKIENDSYLCTSNTSLVYDVFQCVNDTIEACDPKLLVFDELSRIYGKKCLGDEAFESSINEDLVVFAFGKSSHSMAEGLIEYVGKVKAKIVISSPNIDRFSSKYDHEIYSYKGGHPHINSQSIKAGKKALELAESLGEESVVICLISGGGSATFEFLQSGLTKNDSVMMSSIMLNQGMEDHEINVFRKLISLIKGGKLAQAISPAKIMNLIISDDVGNDVESIASGPTVKDRTKVDTALELIEKWELRKHISVGVLSKLGNEILNKSNVNGDFDYPDIDTRIIMDSSEFINRLFDRINCTKHNVKCYGYSEMLRTSVGDCSTRFTDYIMEIDKVDNSPKVIIAGGEIPVVAKENSRGGRNQHLALLILKNLLEYDKEWVFMSIASDGVDFMKGIAGSYVSSSLAKTISSYFTDLNKYINQTNSYEFHKEYNTHLRCKNGTNLNISDIYIYISL